MQVIRLTKEDCEYLRRNYPELTYNHIDNVIIGKLSFEVIYDIFPEITIDDTYEIEINLNKVSELGLPVVREVKGKILEIAQRKGKFYGDLHLNNENGEMCIIIPPEVKDRYPNGFDLTILLHHLEEHFYFISYYEKYNKEPWPSYGHNELGYYQLFLKDKTRYSKDFKAYLKCTTRPEFRRKLKELSIKYKT